jgi:hypothetical protein
MLRSIGVRASLDAYNKDYFAGSNITFVCAAVPTVGHHGMVSIRAETFA